MKPSLHTDSFFKKIRTYHNISKESEAAWMTLLEQRVYKKGEEFVSGGQHSKKIAFVAKGLFSQYYTADNGDVVIKYFFPEQRLAASVSAMLTGTPSMFTVEAIEDSTVLEYDFSAFKQLLSLHADIAFFYIRYVEQHWIIEKEPLEISFRSDTAKTRYDDFLNKYPMLIKRLKKHHIAAYLGVTPTQLSRIFFANK